MNYICCLFVVRRSRSSSLCNSWSLLCVSYVCLCAFVLQRSPNYHEDKQRCEYLHNKLAHIKRLIADYDQRRAQAWCWEHSTQHLTNQYWERSVEPGGGVQLAVILTPLQLLPPQQSCPPTSLPSLFPFPIILLHSFLLFPIFDSTGFIVACNLENLTLTPIFLLYLFFSFFFFFPLNELLWNFIPLDQWKGLPACVKGFGGNTSNLLTFWRTLSSGKKKEQKKYFWASQKILTMYLSLKKRKKEGDLFILGLVVQKKSPQMIYCLTFVENNAKKLPRALCVLTLWSHFARKIHYVISFGKNLSPASFPLFLKTVLDDLASWRC